MVVGASFLYLVFYFIKNLRGGSKKKCGGCS